MADVEASPEYRKLLDHLDRHRDDDDAWSVLGDLLLSAGHPRGELIALGAELDKAAKDAERVRQLNAARAEVIARNRPVLLGSDALLGDLLLTWKHGFIVTAEVPRPSFTPTR